jgi:hypothetical protein
VVDLDGVAVDLDLEVFSGDIRDLDACARLVVRDHVELAADEADLELAYELEVDGAALAGVDDPLLDGHAVLLLLRGADAAASVALKACVAIYRVWR